MNGFVSARIKLQILFYLSFFFALFFARKLYLVTYYLTRFYATPTLKGKKMKTKFEPINAMKKLISGLFQQKY